MKKEKIITIERKVRRFNWEAFFGSIMATMFIITLTSLVWVVFYNITNNKNWSFISAGISVWILLYTLLVAIGDGSFFEEETITEEIKIK